MSPLKSTRLNIELCMGSSCFCRGNRALAAEIKTIIAEHGWDDRVEIRGGLCRDACATGPHVQIDGISCDQPTAAMIENIIEQLLARSGTVSTGKE